MENTIKIGDKIVGKKNNGFGVANDECLLEVTSIDVQDGDTYLSAKFIAHAKKSYNDKCKDSEYTYLPIECFEVASSEVIMKITMASAPKKKEKPAQTFKFKAGLVVNKYDSGAIETNFNEDKKMYVESDENRIKAFNTLIDKVDNMSKEDILKIKVSSLKEKVYEPIQGIFSDAKMIESLNGLINFFKEFQFEPSFRMVNTLSYMVLESETKGIDYIKNYFKLMSSPYASAVEDKMKSPEFKTILKTLSFGEPTEVINHRLKLYYGSQGTGKTTKAMKESGGRCIVCNNSMLPQDLLEDFDFEDGKPGFKVSALRDCIVNGHTMVLDEVNLLPFETLRFLQGILDGKKEFTWKGETIKVHDNFNVIGTMNLMINGMAFGLPAPLVDRCSDIQEFTLSGKDLLSALR